MSAAPSILAIDQGTSNTKVLLIDAASGAVTARASRPMTVSHPQPGWAEQSAEAIWQAVREAIAEVIAAVPAGEVVAVGIANQRETVVLWDAATGVSIAPAPIWQCRRTQPQCEALATAGLGEEVAAISGLGLDPLFPAAKIAWLLDTVPGARDRAARGELRCGTIDSWLLWRLTAGAVHATDASNASRTQLLRLATRDWDARLAEVFAVPLGLMPQVRASDARFGPVAAGVCALPPGVPIRAMMGDSHAALYGHGIHAPGRAKVTIGTGSSVMTPTAARVRSGHGLSETIAWMRGDAVLHALEGNISVSGQAAAFAVRLLGLPDEAALTALAAEVPDSGGVSFVPALAGLGAPHWRSDARGLIAGMTLGTRPAHVARAALEAIALQIGDVLDAMAADLDAPIAAISVGGGATCNALLMQLLADLTQRDVLRPASIEASALGAARMAADALGYAAWDEAAIDRFTPSLSAGAADRRRAEWRRAVERAV
ncbi:FGGY-family carbohydrate kinase [Sphingomonas sp. CLY1604]|uniref:FGGY-family carbohydrate kinase n=1 Tax=Sphingomonas sp. CLY1604 TaxID=3457786 RepID=UPI003FD6EC59